ncbi:hypothetical protein EU527_04350 [Candidatus Thorarchaeota archaeon]|nr:MAG: hypothetical protein EU527_04350 [Candidatus Thorarchaeota archaeon]
MSVPVVFNRRLGMNEINLLFDLIDNTESSEVVNRDQASKFFQLGEAIAFMSSIDDEAIGGTIVYRDRSRLGMVLAAIGMKKEYQDIGIYTVIKSSLPFFRTVAIRDVDVVVSERPMENNLGFPLCFCLPSWTTSVLERIGFVKQQELFSCTLKIGPEDASNHKEIQWDSKPNFEGARSLIWDEGKTLGLMNSLVWMSLDFAAHTKTLRTLTDENATKFIISIYDSEGIAIVGTLAAKENFWVSDKASNILASTIKETRALDIRFPLIGKGQIEMLKTVTEEIGGFLKKESITLMRRRL